MKMRVSGLYGLVVLWILFSGCAPVSTSPESDAPVIDAAKDMDAAAATPAPVASAGRDELPERARYLPEALIPQRVRQYAEDQPVLESPWVTVPRQAGFDTQDAYLLSVYPTLRDLPEVEREAALRGIKRTLPPVLETAADGRANQVYTELMQTYAPPLNLERMNDGALLADLVFHAQSPLRDASPELREAVLAHLIDLTFQGIDPGAIAPQGEGNRSWGGEYMMPRILRPYLMLEIFQPDALTLEQRRTLNRVLMHPFFGFNGQLGIMRFTQDRLAGILNKQVFVFNSLLCAASIMELQMARYPESEELWPGFDPDLPEVFRDLLAEMALNMHNGLMGDGATRYVPSYTHAYYYEGPQMDQLLRNYLNTYDETDPVLMRANRVLADRLLAIGNYYEQTSFRVLEQEPDSRHHFSRAQVSEAKSFGNELVHRPSDPVIHWSLANLSGNRWIRQSGPSLRAQCLLEDPEKVLLGTDLALAAIWNPRVTIGPDPDIGPGFRQNYLLWDRNNLGATGKFDNWAFHFVGRGLMGRREAPETEVPALFQKDSFAGFVARSAGSSPDAEGLRTDHQLTHLPYVGIFPEKTRFWGAVKKSHPQGDGVGPGYPPHWEAARWSATVTDGFAVQASSARAESTDAVCRELWLATPNGAVGLLSGDVSEDPENGDGYARLSFVLQGFFGTRTRTFNQTEGFRADPVPSPLTFPMLTSDGNGFDFLNLRVRVLEQNFTPGAVFAHLTTPEDFYPVDKNSPEMRGIEPRDGADNASHGAVSREVQTRGRFVDGRKPVAVVAVHTGEQAKPVTARRIPALPGVPGEHLVMQAEDGDTRYLVIYNPGEALLDLGTWQVTEPDLPVRVYRSGARYRPAFLDNIEVNPEADKEDEIVYGSVIQTPSPQPLREAVRERIPPQGHVVLVSGPETFQTGGPGFEVRPPVAQWRFRPENRDGESTRELTGQGPALRGGAQTARDAVRVTASGSLTGAALDMPEAGTLRFWIRPDAVPEKAPVRLFASGGSPAWELWSDQDELRLRRSDGDASVSRGFAGGLKAGVWQQVVVSYGSADPKSWTLRVNDAPRAARSGEVPLPAPANTLRIAEGIEAELKDLALHDVVLTPGELNMIHDRERPLNFNRIAIAGVRANVWVNGNRVTDQSEDGVDTDKLAWHLKPGVNVIGIEIEGQQRNRSGDSRLEEAPGIQVRIRDRGLTEAGSAFAAGWETTEVLRDAVGSRLLAAYQTQISRQMRHLDALGKNRALYRKPDWRPETYDRPWLSGKDQLAWEPVTSLAPPGSDTLRPTLPAGEGLRLLRLTFVLDEQGRPQPFTPEAGR